MIQVTHFSKSYRDTNAVDGLSFAVDPGQILGLVGPNGAGKTTTLRAISGIIPPSAGTLTIAGFDVQKDPVNVKRRLAYIPDDPKLFDALTIWEHLEFTASAYRVEGYIAKAELLLEEFQLTEKRNALAQELSRGMRQKVAVCCAYLHDPAVILYDVPIAGLDPRGIRTLKDSMRARADAGAALLVSSHMLGLVEDLCSHLLILHRGKALYHGPIADARRHAEDLDENATLEEVFFRVTEGMAVPPLPSNVPDPADIQAASE